MAYVILIIVVVAFLLVSYHCFPLVIAVLIAISLLVFMDWLRRLIYCMTHANKVYLVCGRQRGWEPFVQNNLIPSLPGDVEPIWQHSPQGHKMVFRLVQSTAYGTSIPFFVLVTPFTVKCHSLNDSLQQLKRQGKTCENTQATAAKIASEELAALRSRYRRNEASY